MHSGYVKLKGCHSVFYGMVRVKVDFCICAGWLSVYVYHELCLFAYYSQAQKINGSMFFIRGDEFDVAVYVVYVFIDDAGTSFCIVVYDKDIIHTSCIKCYIFCV
jgi:hypothetical protein